MITPISTFSLQQDKILDQLKSDQGFFIYAVGQELQRTAYQYGCQVRFSKHRLIDCWDYWKGDIRRTQQEGFSQKERRTGEDHYQVELDPFKQVGFLTFWLRRTSPVIMAYRGGMPNVSERFQERYFAFSNEISTFRIGLLICGFYHSQVVMGHRQDSEAIQTIGRHEIELTDYVMNKFSDWSLVRDYVMTLRHKNMSPHALNLIYKSIFV